MKFIAIAIGLVVAATILWVRHRPETKAKIQQWAKASEVVWVEKALTPETAEAEDLQPPAHLSLQEQIVFLENQIEKKDAENTFLRIRERIGRRDVSDFERQQLFQKLDEVSRMRLELVKLIESKALNGIANTK